jgi:NhaC family Na+:H+ antiporter
MLRVAAIIFISSAYAGIFRKTGMLNHIKKSIAKLSSKITPYGGTLCTSIIAGIVACNQTLTIMLTYELCNDLEPDSQKFAIDLEDTAVVVAPLVPWSIAAAVPLASINAPAACLFAACFLFLLPVWRLLVSLQQSNVNDVG